ncbi:MAG: DUF4625 domain-containing protein [Flavobacteriales bacterium]|nr:MAG: DUF4625 domain-containing protein [Flavobacteriales bacterium]
MKIKFLSTLGLASLMFAQVACKSDDDSLDRKAPRILPAEGRDAIRPGQGEIRRATTSHMHVRFRVVDEDGINQARVDIHHGFDGHSHARGMSSDFVHLDYRKIYEGEGRTEINIDDNFEDVYWEGNNSVIEPGKHILAGPYDFVIDASDVLGNTTSFSNNTSYIAEFWIERNYAPTVSVTNAIDGEINGTAGAVLPVEGSISVNTANSLSSDITFVWVRLYEEDDHHHHGHSHNHSEDIYEEMWGTSQWRTGFSGPAIPNASSLNLEDILTGAKSIQLPTGKGHYELMIIAEDANGNISHSKVKVHVD